MININNFQVTKEFIHSLINALPIGVILVDNNLRVQAVNDFVVDTFNVFNATVYEKNIGEVLKCIDFDNEKSHCSKPNCPKNCSIMSPALAALKHQKIVKHNAAITLRDGNKVENRELLITSSPLHFEDKEFVILLLEDITELSRLKREKEKSHGITKLLGNDPQIVEIREKIKVLSDVDVPVLIQGESGTGKELVASAIHFEGSRADKPFVAVNCGALPESLLESELFGHVKGAFTGAIRDKKGRFELADGGTIFLDEIGDISPVMQVKLLRVLQEGTFEPVGSEKTVKVNVRVVSASNKNIKNEIAKKKFREDLYYRLCVVPINVPPLRERLDDVPLLTHYILNTYASEFGKSDIELPNEVLHILKTHTWPGNVRELQNVIQYALIHAKGNIINPQQLPQSILTHERDNGFKKRTRKRKLDDKSVKEALNKNNGNKVETAKMLGVSRSTLYRFLELLDN